MIWPRFVIAALLLAAPIWAGAAGRSFWMLPVLIGVFALAYIDGKNRMWRVAFAESSAFEKVKTFLGAVLVQSILVALLFFAATGVSVALGALEERAPFDRLDAGVAALALGVCLLGGALVRWAEGGRDPVDRALDSLTKTLEDIDCDQDDVSEPDGAQPDPFEPLEDEMDALAERFLVGDAEVESLSKRWVEAGSPLSVASHLTHLARNPDPETDERVGAGNRLRVVYRAMRRLWGEDRDDIEDIYAASFEALILSTLASGDAPLRLEALKLAEAMQLRGDRLTAALRAIDQEPGLGDEQGQALKSGAARLLDRMTAP